MKKLALVILFLFLGCSHHSEDSSLTAPEPSHSLFAIIGDRTYSHSVDNNGNDIHAKLLAEVQDQQPDFIITVGDMIEGYNQYDFVIDMMWDDYFALLEGITTPIYFTPGNHDIQTDQDEVIYKKRVGDLYYSFDHNNIHIIVLDNSRWAEGEQLLSPVQYDWLQNDLEANSQELTFVFCHQPFWDATLTDNKPTDSLHQLFLDNNIDYVIAGHYHTYFETDYDGIGYMIAGRSGGGSTLHLPQYIPKDAAFAKPDYEPHRFLMVEIIGDSVTFLNHERDYRTHTEATSGDVGI